MNNKTFDKLSLGILTISMSAIVCLLFPPKKISAFFIGSTTCLATSLYAFNEKNKVNRLSYKENSKYNDVRNTIITNYQPQQESKQENKFTSVLIDELPKYSGEKITKWLETKAIKVKNHQIPQASDQTYERLAITLGDNYPHLKSLYQKIKRNLSDGSKLRHSFTNKNSEEIQINTSFCNQLHQYAFLSEYRYNRENKTILATPNRIGNIYNFFSGKWFEQFIYLKASQFLSQQGLDYQYLLNTQIVNAEGRNFELNILFAINQEFLWIECKTGNYQNYINKYSQFRKSLGISKKNSLLVILGIDDRLAAELTEIYEITVSNENLFLKHISEALDINSLEEQKTQSDNLQSENLIISTPRTIKIKRQTIYDRSKLQAILGKAKVRPYPQWRSIILRHIITIVNNDNYHPQPLRQIKEKVASLIDGISNTNIMEVFNTLIMSGCLLDKNQKPLHSFNQNLDALTSDRLDYLEQKCLESYALITLLTDYDYFDSRSNFDDFQETVGETNIDNIDIQKLKILAEQIDNLNSQITTVSFNI